ncbi:hypothetical protein J2Y69_002594 [Microbacterium resistens]|uniref:Lipoprotein n=1 Tax=Microbacterium resistens TaxID=156977 RepID=A0ABU1SEF0_9MICO|nr:hypothetical protein [Microbacterium resistens]MDR6867986.1 hypothetical protein [Microbacterium resistens]
MPLRTLIDARRRLAVLAGSVLAGAAVTGIALTACAPQATAQDGLLVVRDGALRAPDADCAGSGSALFLHAGAVLTAVDDDGRTVLEATLPSGRADRSDDKDYGSASRIPTVCAFPFPAAALEDGRPYTFRVDGTEIGRTEIRRTRDDLAVVAYPLLGDPSATTGDDR